MFTCCRAFSLLALSLVVVAPPAAGQPRPAERDVDGANRAGTALLQQGKVPEAVRELEKAVDLAGRVYGPTDPNVARVRVNLARAYLKDSQYARAEELYRENVRALRAARAARPDQVSLDEIGRALNNYAEFYVALGQWALAEEKLIDALRVFESGGWNGPAAVVRNNLGNVYRKMGKFDDALAHATRSLEFRIEQFGPNDSRVVPALTGVGCILSDLNRHDEAAKFFRRVIQIDDRTRAKEPNPAALANLSLALMQLGQFEEAIDLRVRANARTEEVWGPRASSLGAGRCSLALLRGYRGEWAEAVRLMDRGMRDQHEVVLRIARGLPEAEQFTFLQDFSGEALSNALSVGFARRADPAATAKAAECLLNVKGALFEVMADRALLARDAELTGRAAVADALRAARRELSERLGAPEPGDPAGREALRRLVAELLEQEKRLSRELARAGGRDRDAPPWVELETVRKALPPGQVLIEMAKVARRDFSETGGPKGLTTPFRYLAWVIPPAGAGDVSVVDLGAATGIEAGVAKLLQNLTDYTTAVKSFKAARDKLADEKLAAPEVERRTGELFNRLLDEQRRLERDFRADALDLSRRVVHPLSEAAGGAKTWVLSPDADLWLVPWAALVTPDEKHLAESIALRQVVTGRDLLPVPAPDRKAQGPPLVIADPNYDRGIDAPADRVASANRLAGTRAEAVGIAPHLAAIAGTAPEVRLDAGQRVRRHPGVRPSREVRAGANHRRVRELPRERAARVPPTRARSPGGCAPDGTSRAGHGTGARRRLRPRRRGVPGRGNRVRPRRRPLPTGPGAGRRCGRGRRPVLHAGRRVDGACGDRAGGRLRECRTGRITPGARRVPGHAPRAEAVARPVAEPRERRPARHPPGVRGGRRRGVRGPAALAPLGVLRRPVRAANQGSDTPESAGRRAAAARAGPAHGRLRRGRRGSARALHRTRSGRELGPAPPHPPRRLRRRSALARSPGARPVGAGLGPPALPPRPPAPAAFGPVLEPPG